MSDGFVNVESETVSENTPLSVLLFHEAMTRNSALSDFAREIDINPLSLRQFVSGQVQRPRSKTLEAISRVLDISVDEARRRTELAPQATSVFADWLQQQMGTRYSRAKLARETRISDGALRNYLEGRTVPDPNQAQRLAEALDLPSLVVAKVVVATQTMLAGGKVLPSSNDMMVEQEASEPDDASFEPDQLGDDAAEIELLTVRDQPPTASERQVEEQILHLWRRLHPQGRRATLSYIATLLVED